MCKQVKLIVAVALMVSLGKAQDLSNQHFFVSPGLSVGYTFGAKFNYGFVIDFGVSDVKSPIHDKFGFSFYQYFVHTKKHLHRLRSFSLMYQNDYVDFKIGRGRAKNPWGYTNRNKCIVHGLTLDVSASLPSAYSPWIGYRLFKFNRADWAWFMGPYHSAYIKYKYDVMQNSSYNQVSTSQLK